MCRCLHVCVTEKSGIHACIYVCVCVCGEREENAGMHVCVSERERENAGMYACLLLCQSVQLAGCSVGLPTFVSTVIYICLIVTKK